MTDPTPPQRALKYRAFLSYAHADVSWARWLHGQLEGFRVDEDVVGRNTALGPVPRSLRPVFRDREDFAGGHELITATMAELDESAALIVLCSPIAAQRPAVQEEVRLFRLRHPQRPVIPVIVAGNFPTNFPPSLRFELDADGTVSDRPVTFLGPDLRESGDGRNLGLAKVVAGLTGLDTDLVFRRAERARQRRRRLFAAVALVAFVVVSLLAGWAETQRRKFDNYLALATQFQAFEVVDVTGGWDSRPKLALDTLVALRSIVSARLGFKRVRLLWFDDKPQLSIHAKQRFVEGMRGIGVGITEVAAIGEAKQLLSEEVDVVIANYGSATDRFAYQLLAEVEQRGLDVPVVIYGLEPNEGFAKEARCFGAVARATTIDTLFSAVMRALVAETRPRLTPEQRERCILETIKPYDTPQWLQWLEDSKAGRGLAMPALNWN